MSRKRMLANQQQLLQQKGMKNVSPISKNYDVEKFLDIKERFYVLILYLDKLICLSG